MTDQLVLRSKRNQILEHVRVAGFEATEFQWLEVPSTQAAHTNVSQLTHRPTGAFFLFDFLEGKHWSKFSPGHDKLVDMNYPGDWTNQLIAAIRWLDHLRREVDAPDLWSILGEERLLAVPSAGDTDNEPFSPEELKRVAVAVGELRQYIESTASLSAQQLAYVADRLTHLEAASQRLGRKDWATLALGTLANIIVGAAYAPEAARDLLRTANALLGWVVATVVRLAG